LALILFYVGSVVSCSSQPNPVKLVNGVNRLTSPAVTLQTTKLFGSVEQPDSFGPVLQTTVSTTMYCEQILSHENRSIMVYKTNEAI